MRFVQDVFALDSGTDSPLAGAALVGGLTTGGCSDISAPGSNPRAKISLTASKMRGYGSERRARTTAKSGVWLIFRSRGFSCAQISARNMCLTGFHRTLQFPWASAQEACSMPNGRERRRRATPRPANRLLAIALRPWRFERRPSHRRPRPIPSRAIAPLPQTLGPKPHAFRQNISRNVVLVASIPCRIATTSAPRLSMRQPLS